MANDPTAAGADLAAFAADLRRRRMGAAARAAALRVVLAVAVPALALAWAAPPARWPLLAAVAAAAAIAAATAARREGRLAAAALFDGADELAAAPRLLAELGDELATWLERRGLQRDGMTAWLEADVREKLPALPPQAVAAVGRRRLGGLLWALPLALLLALAWLLADLFAPPWPGLLGGGGGGAAAAGQGGDGEAGGAGGGGGQSTDGEAPQRPAAAGAAPPPPPDGGDPAAPPPEPPTPAEPAPLLELPAQQRFVVPDFVGDGPTRRAKVRAVEVEQGAPTAAAPAATGGAELQSELPPVRPEAFVRAAEQALAARNVPSAERPMVRRYFDRLQQAGR